MMLKLLVLPLLLLPWPMISQSCEEKITRAKKSITAGNYVQAIKELQAVAAGCDNAKANETDELILKIFIEIESLKVAAEESYREAVREKAAKEQAREAAIIAKEDAVIAKNEAILQRNIAEKALDSVKTLAKKAKDLENTFSETSAYDTLYQRGLQYFNFSPEAQSRDYQNALTYFALAQFLKPGDHLHYLVQASKKGIAAEASFLSGNLTQASVEYDSVSALLTATSKECHFEDARKAQIAEVQLLFQRFQATHPINTTAPVLLEGNWYTIPREFGAYQNVSAITFRNNPSNFRKLPAVLRSLPHLESLAFTDCANARDLRNWQEVPRLRSLHFTGNLNLYAITQLKALDSLIELKINHCPALTLVEGCSSLTHFSAEKNPQLRAGQLLLDNHSLQQLALADLPDDALDINNMPELSSLSLARMKATNLRGLEKNTRLKTLKIDSLEHLSAFSPPPNLTIVHINNCDSLKDLHRWAPSTDLTHLILRNNYSLSNLPDWKLFPALKTILIVNDNDITRVPNTRALKKTSAVYLLNNMNLRTNSIHVGFGFDWDVRISSLKLEFEHRRRLRIPRGNPDLGFKAVAVYAHKNFYDRAPVINKNSEGLLLGLVVNYYSQNWFYAGAGVGVGRFQSWFSDQTSQRSTKLVWINNLGAQFAPSFLKKDKLSVNMDLYSVSNRLRDYYIVPSFGLTYYHTLGFHRSTHLIRPGDVRQSTFYKGEKVRIDDLPQKVSRQ